MTSRNTNKKDYLLVSVKGIEYSLPFFHVKAAILQQERGWGTSTEVSETFGWIQDHAWGF